METEEKKCRTAQETFDHVVVSMRKQRYPAARTNEFGAVHCLYRLEVDGKVFRCAAGSLMPDSIEPGRLHGTINALYRNDGGDYDLDATRREIFEATPELGTHNRLVAELQKAHDDPAADHLNNRLSGSWEDAFVAKAREIAEAHGLDPSACDREL